LPPGLATGTVQARWRRIIMVQRDRNQFFQLMGRVREVALKHGDETFAAACGACIIDASGGDPKCPIGDLAVETYGATGCLPSPAEDSTVRPRLPLTFEPPLPYERGQLLRYAHGALEERAVVRHDDQYIKALRACRTRRNLDTACPLHAFVTGSCRRT
jgi:hypothetical protein